MLRPIAAPAPIPTPSITILAKLVRSPTSGVFRLEATVPRCPLTIDGVVDGVWGMDAGGGGGRVETFRFLL